VDPETYPTCVIRARYGGVYEGGAWVALASEPQDVPDAAIGSDVECASWFGEHRGGIGVGATADEAVERLLAIAELERWAPRSAWYHPARLSAP
jgi:hypothetical protein